MESKNQRIYQYYKLSRGIRRGLGVLLAMVIVTFSLPSLATTVTVPKGSAMAAVLKEARGYLDRNPTDPSMLRKAISLLEGAKPQFPGEIRFPLYLAEAYYRLADPNANVNKEFPYYEKSAAYAEQALAMDPKRSEGHYWHGLFLLKQAQKRGISAFFIVKDGIRALENVRRNLPTYDHAGASRVLGLLYGLAPRWTPFGNLDKSIELGEESTRLAPDYPLNRLYLANAYKKRGDKAAAIREYQAILTAAAQMPEKPEAELMDQARTMLKSLGHPI
jgi:tetratricopeptide (TPR) repeat protein